MYTSVYAQRFSWLSAFFPTIYFSIPHHFPLARMKKKGRKQGTAAKSFHSIFYDCIHVYTYFIHTVPTDSHNRLSVMYNNDNHNQVPELNWLQHQMPTV